jgi:putative transport protein
MLTGNMNDLSVLALANDTSGSRVTTDAYAGLYPLTIMLRIETAPILALSLCGQRMAW